MKRKQPLKTRDRETIDPSVLEAVLGVVPHGGQAGQGAIIEQPPFSSFFHS